MTACDCRPCRDLAATCGDANFGFLSRRLLVRGWAGTNTAVERAYQKAHADWSQKDQERGDRLRVWREENALSR